MFKKIKSFFSSVKQKLVKSSTNIKQTVSVVLGDKIEIDEESYEKITDALILSDISIETSEKLIKKIKDRLKSEKFDSDPSEEFFLTLINDEVTKILEMRDSELVLEDELNVILFSGVNGSGKTTSIGKLSLLLSKITNKKIMLVAADTFRAAAVDQLRIWSERSNSTFFSSDQKDPASVVFSALDFAKDNKVDIVIIDTAGRLSNNSDLMSQISKIEKIIISKTNKPPTESLLVLDGTSGQNSLSQVKKFQETIGLTGVVITKLDSTSKAGFAISVSNDYDLPIKFIGVGEKIEDMIPFDAKEFGDALFK
tara:strand:+ start:19707 stop:20639 length:933 start_codon:yes stop_codon:yes gene_type:complete